MENLFDISGKVIVITGATGVLAGELAQYFARCKANVVFLGRNVAKLDSALERAEKNNPCCCAFKCDVLDRSSLEHVRGEVLKKYGRIDAIVNGAGGNMPGATIPDNSNFFSLDFDAWRAVVELNLGGTLLPTLVFGEVFQAQKSGVVLNFSSMTAQSAVTRVFGYSNAKAGIDNFTKWLAVELAKKIGEGVRVNAIAPGFFISEQNRALLTNPDGSPTQRGAKVMAKTPFGRFGKTEEIFGAAHFLISDASKFITGIVLPIDGGFSCFSGV